MGCSCGVIKSEDLGVCGCILVVVMKGARMCGLVVYKPFSVSVVIVVVVGGVGCRLV